MNPHRQTKLPFFVHRCVRSAEAVLNSVHGGALDSSGVRNETVVLGVSGGGDSMALLEIVGLLAPRLGLSLHVVCVDHGQRAEADAESQLVRNACQRWGAVFESVTVEPGGSDEDALRRARHAALEDARVRSGSRFVLLGHTSDDQIETVVLRFLRGAGFGGLSGMRQARATLLRPLLGIRRAELRRLLEARAVEWAEDPSNQTDRYARGRLRSAVLPAIETAFGRGALDHLLDVAPRWRADEDFLEHEASRLLAYASRRRTGGIDLDANALAGAHGALRARVLRRWLLDSTGRAPGSRQIREIEKWLEAGDAKQGHLDLAGGRLTGAGGRLSLEVRIEPASAMAVGNLQADPVGIAKSGIDITASSDDPSKARPGCDEQKALAAKMEGATEDSAAGKAVLPPSDGRVRFPRN